MQFLGLDLFLIISSIITILSIVAVTFVPCHIILSEVKKHTSLYVNFIKTQLNNPIVHCMVYLIHTVLFNQNSRTKSNILYNNIHFNNFRAHI